MKGGLIIHADPYYGGYEARGPFTRNRQQFHYHKHSADIDSLRKLENEARKAFAQPANVHLSEKSWDSKSPSTVESSSSASNQDCSSDGNEIYGISKHR